MTTKTSKKRVSVPLAEAIYNQLEADAEAMGVSSPTFASFIIGDYYKKLNQAQESSQKVMLDALSQYFKPDDIQKVIDEARKQTNQEMMAKQNNDNTDK